MNSHRIERMTHESEVPETALRVTILAAFALVVFALATPAKHTAPQIASSLIDARAAAPAGPERMPPPAANATEGNVTDLSY